MALTIKQAIATQVSLAYLGRPQDVGALTTFGFGLTADAIPSPTATQLAALFATTESKAVFGATATMSSVVAKSFELVGRVATSQNITDILTWANDSKLDISQLPWEIIKIAMATEQLLPQASQVVWARLSVAYQLAEDISGNATALQSLATSTTQQDAARAVISGVTSFATIATAYPATGSGTAANFVSGVASSSGQTFTLTTGIDTFPGTSGSDIYQGDSANIGGLDKLFAAGGTADTLNLTSTAAAVTLSSNNITGMEVINFTAATLAHTATLGGLTGITNVNNSGSTVALTVGVGANSLASLAAVGISGTAQATTVVFQEAAVTGSSDAVTVTVSGVTGAAAVNLNTETATATVAGAIETINVVSTGSTNSITLNTNDTQGLGTINVSGANAITIALGAVAATDAIVLNASTATGAVTITNIGAGNTFAAVATGHTITGGSGNDTFTFTAGYIGAEATVASGTRDVINGGTGTDRLNIVAADAVTASAAAQVNLTSIEALTISDAISGTQAFNITRFADVTALTLTAAIAADYTGSITLNSGTAVTLGASTVDNATVTFVVGGTGVTDAMTLNTAGFSFGGTNVETFTGIETLNINTGATVVATSVFAAATTLTQSAGSTSSTITASGVNGLTFTGVITGASLLDASALTGVLTVTAAAAAAITIRGGSANDTINGSAAADLIVGGAGNDTLLGAAGNDSIEGGDGADLITGGTGADTLTGGAGADRFIFAKGATGGADGAVIADVITDFVVGTDKIQFTVTGTASANQAAVQTAVSGLAAGSTETAIINAMLTANAAVADTVLFAVFGGDTFVLLEGAAAGDTFVVAEDVFIKLTGVASGFTFAGDVIPA